MSKSSEMELAYSVQLALHGTYKVEKLSKVDRVVWSVERGGDNDLFKRRSKSLPVAVGATKASDKGHRENARCRRS